MTEQEAIDIFSQKVPDKEGDPIFQGLNLLTQFACKSSESVIYGFDAVTNRLMTTVTPGDIATGGISRDNLLWLIRLGWSLHGGCVAFEFKMAGKGDQFRLAFATINRFKNKPF